jgi:hypothetical protein
LAVADLDKHDGGGETPVLLAHRALQLALFHARRLKSFAILAP